MPVYQLNQMMSDVIKMYAGLAVTLIVIISSAIYIHSSNSALQKAYNQEQLDRVALERSLLALQPNDITIGATDPEIHLFIYTDTDCPYCHDYEADLDLLLEHHGDRVAITYRPIDLPIYPHSKVEHLVLECVGTTAGAKNYRRFQNEVLFKNKALATADYQESLLNAAEIYTSRSDLDACIQDEATEAQIARKGEVARVLGVTKTPTTFFVARDGTTIKRAGNYVYQNLLSQIQQVNPDF